MVIVTQVLLNLERYGNSIRLVLPCLKENYPKLKIKSQGSSISYDNGHYILVKGEENEINKFLKGKWKKDIIKTQDWES